MATRYMDMNLTDFVITFVLYLETNLAIVRIKVSSYFICYLLDLVEIVE